MFGSKRQEVRGEERNMHEEFYEVFLKMKTSLSIINHHAISAYGEKKSSSMAF
jgi:hypothetical protein